MSIAIRESELKAENAGLLVRELSSAIEVAQMRGDDTTDLKAQLNDAARAAAVAKRTSDVATYKEIGNRSAGGGDAHNLRAHEYQNLDKAHTAHHNLVGDLQVALRLARQRKDADAIADLEQQIVDANTRTPGINRQHAASEHKLRNPDGSGAPDLPRVVKVNTPAAVEAVARHEAALATPANDA